MDYETFDIGNLDVSKAKTGSMLPGEYARELRAAQQSGSDEFGARREEYRDLASGQRLPSRCEVLVRVPV